MSGQLLRNYRKRLLIVTRIIWKSSSASMSISPDQIGTGYYRSDQRIASAETRLRMDWFDSLCAPAVRFLAKRSKPYTIAQFPRRR
jgi:hypothetical protein